MIARWLLPLLLAACGQQPDPEPATVVPAEPVARPDSLALRTASGIEVWFVAGRDATDSAGAMCHERGLEIRDADGARGVPLLYTLEAPRVLDDTSVRAVVFVHCQPGEAYRVSLRTGRPTPLAP